MEAEISSVVTTQKNVKDVVTELVPTRAPISDAGLVSPAVPIAKLEFPKAKLEALEVNMRQWGIFAPSVVGISPPSVIAEDSTAASSPVTPAHLSPDCEGEPSRRRIGSANIPGMPVQRVQTWSPGDRRIGSIKPASMGTSVSLSSSQQIPTPRMEFPKAKLETLEVNKLQWGIGLDVPLRDDEERKVVTRRVGSSRPVGTTVQRVETRGPGGRRIGSIKPVSIVSTPMRSSSKEKVNAKRQSSAAVPTPRMEFPKAKLEALGVNKLQWGIDVEADVPVTKDEEPTAVVTRRIGSIRPAGMHEKSIPEQGPRRGRRIGSIRPVGLSAEGSKVFESQHFVEMYNAGKPLVQAKETAISQAKRAAMRENLRRCARRPYLNLGLGQEWETVEV